MFGKIESYFLVSALLGVLPPAVRRPRCAREPSDEEAVPEPGCPAGRGPGLMPRWSESSRRGFWRQPSGSAAMRCTRQESSVAGEKFSWQSGQWACPGPAALHAAPACPLTCSSTSAEGSASPHFGHALSFPFITSHSFSRCSVYDAISTSWTVQYSIVSVCVSVSVVFSSLCPSTRTTVKQLRKPSL